MKQLAIHWTAKETTPEEKARLEQSIRHSTTALRRLKEILEDRLAETLKQEVSPSAFEDPSWAYKQAYQCGLRKQLNDTLGLLAFLD